MGLPGSLASGTVDAVDAATETNLTGRKARAKAGAPDPQRLLAWYDVERRTLPWRAAPGEAPDPYRVWLSEIMLQQTRVETVARYFSSFVARWPNVNALAAAPLSEVLSAWAGLGYYARARNLHACAREVAARHSGRFPQAEAELRTLPGIGRYTAAAIAAIAFGRRVVPIDGNVQRVVARLFAFTEPLSKAKPELQRLAGTLATSERPGDFAQALMDLGATVCTPRRPDCRRCPWEGSCLAARGGNPEQFPRTVPKRIGRLRRGAAFVVLREDGAILVRTRPARGLLGGMSEVPNTEWLSDFDAASALERASEILSPLPFGERSASEASRVRGNDRNNSAKHGPPHPIPLPVGEGEVGWRRIPGIVRHVFTHFPLELTIYAAGVRTGARAPKGMRFVPVTALDDEALPTLMRKVIAHALEASHPKQNRRKA
jgi:A/G-specific adenine glycosylase